MYGQNRIQVEGKILNQNNKSVAFASVSLGVTGIGTVCDQNGKFVINIPKQKKAILNISSIGYEKKQVLVDLKNKTNLFISVRLKAKTTSIDEVTVTGQSVVHQINKTAYNVTAIDAVSLHNTTGNLANALVEVPGVKLRESGGVGSNIQLSLDGFTGKHIKLFIDGVPQEGVGRSFGLNNIPINFAERIEVYKGVVPVGFGADAIGGVVNIVTGNKHRTFVDVSYSYGSFNTHKSYVNIGHTTENGFMFEINMFQNYSDNSYSIDTPVKDFETGVWDTSKEEHVKRFHDGYHNEAVIGKVGLVGSKIADRLVFGITYSQNDKEIQNGVVQEIVYGQKRSKGYSIMPSLEYKKGNLFLDGLDVNFTINYNKNLAQNIDTSAYRYNWRGEKEYAGNLGEQSYQDSEFENNNWNGTFTAGYPLGERHTFVLNHVLTAFSRNVRSVPDAASSGANAASLFDKESQKNITGLSYRFSCKEALNVSVFGKYYNQYSSGPRNTSTSGYNYIEASTNVDAFGYGTAGSYSFLNGFQGKFSYEKAMRLPTTDELFGDEDLEMGASGLRPEKSDNVNISMSYRYEFGKHSVYVEGGLIYRDTKDYIRRITDTYSGGLTYASHENHGRVRTKGVNAGARYTYSDWFSFGGNFTSLDIKDDEKYVSGSSLQKSTTYKVRMPNVPYLFSNVDASFYVRNLFSKTNILTITYDNCYVHQFPLYWENHGSSNKKYVPNQFSHNMSLIYSFKNGRYNFSLECENFTDEQLYDNFSLQKAGRAFYCKVRYYFSKNK